MISFILIVCGYVRRWAIKVCTRLIKPIALSKAKIVHNFGLSECNRVQKMESQKMGYRTQHFDC